MKFGLFSTNPELEKLQRGFVARAVVSQTQYIFSVCKKGSYLSGSFVKTRSARNAQSFALGRANVELEGSSVFPLKCLLVCGKFGEFSISTWLFTSLA